MRKFSGVFCSLSFWSHHVRRGPAAAPAPVRRRPPPRSRSRRSRRTRMVSSRRGCPAWRSGRNTMRSGATGPCTTTGSVSSSGSRRRLRRPGFRRIASRSRRPEMTGFDATVDYACRLVDDPRALANRSTSSAPPGRAQAQLLPHARPHRWPVDDHAGRQPVVRHRRHAHQPGRRGPGAGVRSARHPAADGSGRVRRPPRLARLHLGGEPAPRRREGRRPTKNFTLFLNVTKLFVAAARSASRAPRDTTSWACRSRR